MPISFAAKKYTGPFHNATCSVIPARTDPANLPPEYLFGCTLMATVEPCAICPGTVHWAHNGHLDFGMTERHLLVVAGHHADHPTTDMLGRS